jgi:hypothetical protein
MHTRPGDPAKPAGGAGRAVTLADQAGRALSASRGAAGIR